jgi:hypothetical protein
MKKTWPCPTYHLSRFAHTFLKVPFGKSPVKEIALLEMDIE